LTFDPLGVVIKAALLAGLVAGLLVATVQFVWTEPIVDRAISVEEQVHAADRHGIAEPPPVVDRPTQKKGLFLGYAIYGIAWGLLFGSAYAIAQPHLPGSWGRLRRGLLLALAAYWAVGLLPFLKYPANPPGVGDPDTIDFRQRLYLAMLVGAILLVAAAYGAGRRAAPRLGQLGASALTLGIVAAGSVVLFFGLPNNPDAIRAPLPLVLDFRLHSLAGITLFWLLTGLGFGLALRLLPSPALSRKLLTGRRNPNPTIS